MNAILLIMFATIPADAGVLRESVDCIERNHFYDDQGRHVFDQVIFYEWDGERHQVIAWRLDKRQFSFLENPPTLIWIEPVSGAERLRVVRGGYWRETFSQFDPELCERETLPKERRRELRKP